jgi:hypothetical protein
MPESTADTDPSWKSISAEAEYMHGETDYLTVVPDSPKAEIKPEPVPTTPFDDCKADEVKSTQLLYESDFKTNPTPRAIAVVEGLRGITYKNESFDSVAAQESPTAANAPKSLPPFKLVKVGSGHSGTTYVVAFKPKVKTLEDVFDKLKNEGTIPVLLT